MTVFIYIRFPGRFCNVWGLTEGRSIRATERLTGIHRDTIMRLGIWVGNGCQKIHDRCMRDRVVNRSEISTDGLRPYIDAIDDAFGAHCLSPG